jgi:DNA (cytosine-5)-methyltransferase 1
MVICGRDVQISGCQQRQRVPVGRQKPHAAHRVGRLWKIKKDEIDEWGKPEVQLHKTRGRIRWESKIMEHSGQIQTGSRTKRKVYAVDLFCGAGGLTHGLERTGIDVRLGVDIDPACKYPYLENNSAKFLLKPVEELKASDIERTFRKNGISLLAGCAPCQTFSTYNQKATPDDKRWWLLHQFARLVQEVSPELVTMENVPRLEEQGIFEEFLGALHDAQYHVAYNIVSCEDYGIPQHRQRLVLLASKLGPIRLLPPSEFGADRKIVRDCIADLPTLKAGETNGADPLHQAAALSKLNRKRIKASRPGGTWRDWEKPLVADCHKKRTGKTYPSVYGRMCWDEPAPTITTQFFGFGNGRFGHPKQDRAISLREGAILQSFPNDYVFVPPGKPIYKKSVGKLIGNAVPPMLGEVIGLSILEHVDQWTRNRRKSSVGARGNA